MFKTYTQQELVDRWRLMRHLEPLSADVTVSFDGIDTSELDVAEAMGWWCSVVDTAPMEWLHATDMKDEAKLAMASDTSCVELTMPPNKPLRRVRALRLDGWQKEASIVEPGSPRALLQTNDASRAGVLEPVAVRLDPWHLRLFPATSTRLLTLEAVDETDYTFDERCWSL